LSVGAEKLVRHLHNSGPLCGARINDGELRGSALFIGMYAFETRCSCYRLLFMERKLSSQIVIVLRSQTSSSCRLLSSLPLPSVPRRSTSAVVVFPTVPVFHDPQRRTLTLRLTLLPSSRQSAADSIYEPAKTADVSFLVVGDPFWCLLPLSLSTLPRTHANQV
jgi:hypothetical protein